jgi:hypothetical protein
MERGTYTLLVGCGKQRTTFTFKNSKEVELWNEIKIRKELLINPQNISGIIIGPGLVIEIFSDAYYSKMENVLENNTNPKGHKFELGCLDDHSIFKGTIRSFKVWDYDEYHANGKLVKYCDKDVECGDKEMCLCPGGEKLKEWCPLKRKRCLNKGLYFHSARKTTWNPDLINSECMMKLIDDFDSPWPQYGELKNMAKICQNKPMKCKPSKDIRDKSIYKCNLRDQYKAEYINTKYKRNINNDDIEEGFDYNISKNDNNNIIMMLVIFIIIAFYFKKFEF